jgi:hypothetical protein
MSKAPTPKTDRLREMREARHEARYGGTAEKQAASTACEPAAKPKTRRR